MYVWEMRSPRGTVMSSEYVNCPDRYPRNPVPLYETNKSQVPIQELGINL